jgi:hypothetical protein
MRTSFWSLEESDVSAELKRFIAEKCAQLRAETRAAEHPMSPESKSLFRAAQQGDWQVESLRSMHQAAWVGEPGGSKSWAVYPVEGAAVKRDRRRL